MKKSIFLIFIFALTLKLSFGQKNNNVWLVGYPYYSYYTPIIDFYYGYPDSAGIPSDMFMGITNASICNDSGDLQFYTNGADIENKYCQALAGSDSFNFGDWVQSTDEPVGFPQCAIIIPYPGHPEIYYLFHLTPSYIDAMYDLQPVRLEYSIVDMNQNDGEGLMTQKNQTVLNDTLSYGTLQAVKHGNGNDWWVTVHKFNSNIIYSVRLSNNGIDTIVKQPAGYNMDGLSFAQSTFSPDDKYYAIADPDSNNIHLFNFDIQQGVFAFNQNINFPVDSLDYGVWGCCFSPNNRYLYVTNSRKLFQLDLLSGHGSISPVFISSWIGHGDTYENYFSRMCLGPDNKIYISAYNASLYMDVIANPNEEGSSCNFINAGFKAKSYMSSIPDLPEYRLRMDTTESGVKNLDNLSAVSIYPNLTDKSFSINYSGNHAMAPLYVTIYNSIGQKIQELYITPENTFSNQVNISDYASGLYIVNIKMGNSVQNYKVIKM